MIRYRSEEDDMYSVVVLDKMQSSASTKEFEAVHSLTRKNGDVNLKGVLSARKTDDSNVMQRESRSLSELLTYSAVFLCVDVARQTCTYALKYMNNDTYPLPQTFLVFFAEIVKLIIFSVKLIRSGGLRSVAVSYRYMVPSTLYAINNNIYFLALYYTTPPVWNILMQARIVCTAMVYRVFFKCKFRPMQWVALMILMSAIILTQFSHADSPTEGGNSRNIAIALTLAVVGSIIASIGPIYTEYLLKNDRRSFDDKQFQLYMFGTVVTGVIGVSQVYIAGHESQDDVHFYGDKFMLSILAALVIFFASCGGIATAYIMKRLDNIVKLYAQAMSTIVTTLACVICFPRRFQFDITFIGCLALTMIAIFLYEFREWGTIGARFRACVEFVRRSNVESKWYIVCVKYLASLVVFGALVGAIILVLLSDYLHISVFK